MKNVSLANSCVKDNFMLKLSLANCIVAKMKKRLIEQQAVKLIVICYYLLQEAPLMPHFF